MIFQEKRHRASAPPFLKATPDRLFTGVALFFSGLKSAAHDLPAQPSIGFLPTNSASTQKTTIYCIDRILDTQLDFCHYDSSELPS
jgi:hypothetical protein